MIAWQRCVTVVCDVCAAAAGDAAGGVAHFAGVGQARAALGGEGWVVCAGGQVLCAGCAAARVCAEQGHDFGGWRGCRCGGRVRGPAGGGCARWRGCLRCGESEFELGGGGGPAAALPSAGAGGRGAAGPPHAGPARPGVPGVAG